MNAASVTPPDHPPAPTATAGASPAPPANTSAPSSEMPWQKNAKRFWSIVAVAVVAFVFIAWWVIERATTSITDDAFIEAHIVNIAPEAVSGHLVRYLVDENDPVENGQLLAEIDPVPYRDQVELARSKLDGTAGGIAASASRPGPAQAGSPD